MKVETVDADESEKQGSYEIVDMESVEAQVTRNGAFGQGIRLDPSTGFVRFSSPPLALVPPFRASRAGASDSHRFRFDPRLGHGELLLTFAVDGARFGSLRTRVPAIPLPQSP